MSFAASVCMIWWCFAGFEACVAMGEEIKYPRINIPRALFLAPFVVFAVNALFQWFLIAITPVESLASLATAQAPYADAMKAAGILGLPLALLAAGVAFGGDFSTMNAAIATIPRYLFTMARDGVMPSIFAKTSRFQTPHVAIITLGVLTMALIATDSLIYIASLSLFADLLYYVIGILAAWALRRRRPELQRPYKAPLVAVGAPVSAIIYLYMMTQLDTNAFITGVIWCVLGLAIYFYCSRRNAETQNATPTLEQTGALDMPQDPSEIAAMDREYLIWKVIVAAACILAVLLYALPYLAA